MTFSDVLALLVEGGHGRNDDSGQYYCSLKDVCDSLKNTILVGTLLAAAASVALGPSPGESGGAPSVTWMGAVGVVPLAIMFIGLVRQGIFIAFNLPGCRKSDAYRYRAILVTAAALLLIGLVLGLLGIGVAAVANVGLAAGGDHG